ncbi:DUF4133 domain-containing protein [Echinicola vietnamensis]|uniref:DUF4133 domain-containing protein n=1 Tax=Echinicola vietnamensis (strain DSM 17526 / LMG 23754 / KMM 6221) TaxID=926556 RepID=L0FY28_ECHVK|nr:DUF4133 domain-containing protein [Echinicola vietnamensis]AGA78202.1 hypothetical protein Echvi_1948 [Echinicola vietnamensis DSM 17526]
MKAYRINKGINKPLEFKGLKAQYIAYLAIGLVALLILFAVAYMLGLSKYLCLAGALILGGALFYGVFHYSHTYGQHGLMKKMAYRQLPQSLRCRSRKPFLQLQKHDDL